MKKIKLLYLSLLLVSIGQLYGQKKVLVITETVGYDHNTRGVVVPMITQLGLDNGFGVESTNTSTGYFTTQKLAEYAAILFMNTTGDFLNAEEQTAFEGYINNGGGAMFNHAAADAEYNWPYYHQLLGATFQGHYYGIFTNDLIIADKNNIATSFLPGNTWRMSEEYYYFTPRTSGGNVANPPMVDPGTNSNIKHLLLMDNATSPHGEDIVHPVSFYQYFGGGRSWYSTFGHSTQTYDIPYLKQHFLGGILFVIGDYNPNGPAMSVSPQSVSFGMKEGDYTTVPPFDVTVTNATPSLGALSNLSLVSDQSWLDISSGVTNGDKVVFSCALNATADALGLGDHTVKIAVSADSVMTQYVTIKITVSPGGPNLALNKPITGSSSENGATGAINANDGKLNTRWSSLFKDGESITIDLQAIYNVNFVKITWEGAYADQYEILMGDDLQNLSQVYLQSNGKGGVEEMVLDGTGRYIRLVCTSRATPYGSSLFEFEAYGKPAVTTALAKEESTSFSIYPTLLHGNELNVSMPDAQLGNYTVDLVSSSGELLAKYEVVSESNDFQLTLPNNIGKGVYFVRLSSSRGVSTNKFIKIN